MKNVSLSTSSQCARQFKSWLPAFVCLVVLSVSAQATNLQVHCGGKYGITKIGSALKVLDPERPHTLTVSGTCKENVLIQGFNRLTLIATTGATISDASGGTGVVVDIEDSTDIVLQGFTISGGSSGVLCFDGSLCRFSGNTIEGSTNGGVWVNHSQAVFSGDVFQDTGDPGLGIEAANVTAYGVTVQRSAGGGIYDADGSVLEAYQMNIQDNRGDGILVVSQSHMELGGSTLNNNAYNGIDVGDQSEVLLIQNTATGNAYNGVSIGDLSLAELGNGGTFTGNGADIWCGGQYSVAANIQAATYGTTNCPIPSTQAGASKRSAPLPRPMRPAVK
jgi:parallel beta-helix repeat protein